MMMMMIIIIKIAIIIIKNYYLIWSISLKSLLALAALTLQQHQHFAYLEYFVSTALKHSAKYKLVSKKTFKANC